MGPSLRSEREGLNTAKWVSLKIGYRFRTKVDFSSFVEMKIQGIHQRDEPNQSNHHFWWWRILHIYFIFGVDPLFDGLNANFSDPDHILAYSPSFSETQLHFFFLRLQLSVDVDWSSSTANFVRLNMGYLSYWETWWLTSAFRVPYCRTNLNEILFSRRNFGLVYKGTPTENNPMKIRAFYNNNPLVQVILWILDPYKVVPPYDRWLKTINSRYDRSTHIS